MSTINPRINNLTNYELIMICENDGYCVNVSIIKEICIRLDSLSGQVSMWHTLADATKNVNSSLIKELRVFQTRLDELTGD